MSVKVFKEKEVNLSIKDLESPIRFRYFNSKTKMIIKISECFKKKTTSNVYMISNKIPFNESDPNFQKIMLEEFNQY